jgi:hypothetical protein
MLSQFSKIFQGICSSLKKYFSCPFKLCERNYDLACIDGKRSKWIAKILEFDLEVKPTQLIKGQGLSRLLVESNCKALGVNFMCTNCINKQSEIPNSSL